MKSLKYFLFAVAASAMLFAGCKKEDPLVPEDTPTDGAKVVATLKQADVIAAAADMYNAWDESRKIAESMKVGNTELTQPQYIYALAKVVVDIKDGKKTDVDVLSYRMSESPDKDSYDKDEIAVFNGPANGDATEDLANIAEYLMSVASDKGRFPNSVLYTRSNTEIAFSVNRATVTMLRALSEYKTAGKMPEKVSTEYLSAKATLREFATQFVTCLDVWENTVTETLSSDGSHTGSTAWKNVHFVPIPYSGGYTDGADQYQEKFKSQIFEIEVAGQTYTAAQCWGIALKGILDLVTVEGSTVWEVERTPATPAHTLGNGKKFDTSIPMLEEWFQWGQYPWYEREDDGGAVKYNEQPITEVDVAFLVRLFPWHLTRSSQLGNIGNFQHFSTDPAASLVYEGYLGLICPMRELLIAARFYKYLLDNNITENVYDAVKNVKFSFDLYGEVPVAVDVDKLSFTHEGGEQKINVTTSSEDWTASVEGEGVTITPASGKAGETTEVTVSMAKNEGVSRTATITITVPSGKTATVAVAQAAVPSGISIRDFAQEYVKLIDIWMANVGVVNSTTGIGANNDNLDVQNAHYVPEETTIKLGKREFNLADAVELASRSYLLLRGYDGNDIKTYGRNLPIAKIDVAYTMDSEIPETHSYTWGQHPFAERTNGGAFKMVTSEGEFERCKVDLLDDYSHRHTNYPFVNEGAISNFCSYVGNYLAGYDGCCCAKRIMMAYAYFFKYMLDNNLQDAKSISPDQVFEAPLFGENIPAAPEQPEEPEQPAAKEIATAQDFVDFLKAVKAGESVEKWTNDNGEVTLAADIDLAGVNYDWTTHAVAVINANNDCTIDVPAFTGVFDGKNHKITGFKPTVELAAGTTFGLFPVIKGATIKNVNLTGEMTVSAKETADAGMFVGTAFNSTIKNVTVNGKLVSTGGQVDNKRFALAGICGFIIAKEGQKSLVEGCTSNVEVNAAPGANTKNGATCAMSGVIVSFATTDQSADARVTLKSCVNNGTMNVSLARCSGITPTANWATTLEDCTNNGDQINKCTLSGRIGNIVCNLAAESEVINCVNNGDIDLTVEGYSGTVGGLIALVGSDVKCQVKGGGNYGTIKTLSTAGKYIGLLWANHNKTVPTSDMVVSGRLFIDGKEVEINADNYMSYLGYVKDPTCLSNITWVAPTK